MRNIQLTISYDGSRFHGWQKQGGLPTIQGAIERAIFKMTGEKTPLIGSGRTDAGVHAIAQVANFKTKSKVPCIGFLKGLNSLLPEDISITSAREVELDFHARKHAQKKEYFYRIVISPVRLPLISKRAWVISRKLNLNLMEEALGFFIGSHDFSSFAASGSSVKSYVRTVCKAELSHLFCAEYPGQKIMEIRIALAANGFLRYMVRNIVGFLVEIGLEKRSIQELSEVFEKKDRNHGAPTAPPQGLYLLKVFY